MKLYIDTADLLEIQAYEKDPDVSGFTTNATLIKSRLKNPTWENRVAYTDRLIGATTKDISIQVGSGTHQPHVRWKYSAPLDVGTVDLKEEILWNWTAVCSPSQVPACLPKTAIISVFAGRIMDTGRSPEQIIRLAQRTGAQVLWASSRSVYDITMAEQMGCDIITVTPAIYEKYREWHGKPLELVAQETIAQFERDRA